MGYVLLSDSVPVGSALICLENDFGLVFILRTCSFSLGLSRALITSKVPSCFLNISISFSVSFFENDWI